MYHVSAPQGVDEPHDKCTLLLLLQSVGKTTTTTTKMSLRVTEIERLMRAGRLCRLPVTALVRLLKRRRRRFDTVASALLSLQKGCGLWTLSVVTLSITSY